jgi:hypothetical protein
MEGLRVPASVLQTSVVNASRTVPAISVSSGRAIVSTLRATIAWVHHAAVA